MITKRSYFIGDIQIANANDTAPSSNLIGNAKELDMFIARYEREVLIYLFGAKLYKEFSQQFDVDTTTGQWTLKSLADQKWKDLLEGKEYTYGSRDYIWRGLVYSDLGTTPNTSLMSYYIYAKFIEADELRHSGVGFAKDQAQNSTIQLGRSKWAFAYNQFILMTGELYEYLYHSNRATPDIYKDWRRKRFAFVNRFGL